ncbi:hypothetical protein HOV35_gp02 [Escherichia phage Sortsne]|uniref:Uncharacterized protein n=1 Tax=Escherichia phage Sortsne TaxID=2562456 RepID=A0A4D6DYV2_9CAUD|nr:hypothetical protein HOV35_gp02 [Escherichia phage Sortsne]QBZ71567.1 hypothetical protein [Escherichia phage Sortsne]
MEIFGSNGVAPVRRKTSAEKLLEILEKVTPTDLSIQDAIDRGVLDRFGVTQEVRDAFARLRPSEQIFAAFFGVEGVNDEAMMALCRHTANMERAGLLRDLKVDRSLIECAPVESDGLDHVIPPGVEVGPELAAAVLRCREQLRSKQ